MNTFAAVVSLVLMLQASAGPSGTIDGIVCQVDGCEPIAGARISLEMPNSNEKRTVTSSENGAFHFSQLPVGRYELHAEANDFNPVAVMPLVSLADGGRAEDLAADSGEFSMEMIPPGNYTAIAFPADEQFTPMFLTESRWVERYERYGQPIHINAGETSRADLVTVVPERK